MVCCGADYSFASEDGQYEAAAAYSQPVQSDGVCLSLSLLMLQMVVTSSTKFECGLEAIPFKGPPLLLNTK